jgi:RNA-directed DNA polymerase
MVGNNTGNNLFQKFSSFENLHLAFQKAKRLKKFRRDVLEFEYRLEYNLLTLQKELRNNTYQHGGYRKFIVKDPKKREIKAAPFRDRVVHHAVINIIEPIFDKGFIFDSYACRKNKGTHRAVQRLKKFIQSIKSKQALSRERERERERESKNPGKFTVCNAISLNILLQLTTKSFLK